VERGLLAGLWMAGVGFGAYAWLLAAGVLVEMARNELLLLMVLMQNVDAFNARSETRSVFRVPLGNNPLLVVGVATALAAHVGAMHLPLLQRVLDVAPLTPTEWIELLLLALTLLVVMEAQKRTWRWRRGRGTPCTGGRPSAAIDGP
jgi:Ca2+-transporting ATPase